MPLVQIILPVNFTYSKSTKNLNRGKFKNPAQQLKQEDHSSVIIISRKDKTIKLLDVDNNGGQRKVVAKNLLQWLRVNHNLHDYKYEVFDCVA